MVRKNEMKEELEQVELGLAAISVSAKIREVEATLTEYRGEIKAYESKVRECEEELVNLRLLREKLFRMYKFY